MKNLTIYTDGASRGNPGNAASAWLILEGTDVLESSARYLGTETNNTAEYTALISALSAVQKYSAPADTALEIFSDSELMIRQLQNKYRVQSPALKKLYEDVRAKEQEFAAVSYTHVPRENPYIGACDWLCNQTLDTAASADQKPTEKPAAPITCTPVGIVHSSYRTLADSPHHGRDAVSPATVEILPQYAEALDGLHPGDHVHILCWYHLSDRSVLKVKAPKNAAGTGRGVFSTRSPVRPNPISLSLAHIDAIDGCMLTVTGLEAVDGTPVLDIKPYFADSDTP